MTLKQTPARLFTPMAVSATGTIYHASARLSARVRLALVTFCRPQAPAPKIHLQPATAFPGPRLRAAHQGSGAGRSFVGHPLPFSPGAFESRIEFSTFTREGPPPFRDAKWRRAYFRRGSTSAFHHGLIK